MKVRIMNPYNSAYYDQESAYHETLGKCVLRNPGNVRIMKPEESAYSETLEKCVLCILSKVRIMTWKVRIMKS